MAAHVRKGVERDQSMLKGEQAVLLGVGETELPQQNVLLRQLVYLLELGVFGCHGSKGKHLH